MAANTQCLRGRSVQENNLSNLRRGVREKLRSGVFRLSERRGSRRSAVWEHFRMVEDERGGRVGYAGCLHCLDVLRHDPHVSGTSSLFSHLRSCPAYAAQDTHLPVAVECSEVSVKEEVMEDDLQQEQQQDAPLLEACVDCLVSDLLPLRALHGTGFLHLAQLLVDSGAQQATDALALLPTRVEVEMRVARRATEARQQLRRELADGVERGASLVLSQCGGQQGPCLLLLRTLHAWRPQTRFLGVCSPPLLKADHDELQSDVTAILKKFELADARDKDLPLVWRDAMQSWGATVPCASHMLGRAVKHMLEAPQPPLQQVRDHLNKFRGLLRWVAASQEKHLAEQLPMDDDDQQTWQRTLAMVEGVCRVRVELKRTGPPRELRSALGDAAIAVMEELVALLHLVRAATAELEMPEIATLHKVVPWLLHLRNSCTADVGDSETKATMKAALREGLDLHANAGRLHRVAVFFNPRMSSLKVLHEEEQQEVRHTILSMASCEAPPAVKGGTNTIPEGPLAYLEDVRQDTLTVEREMEVYTIMRDNADPDDLLAWWCRNAPLLPLLAATAARVLVVPASSVTPYISAISDRLLRVFPLETAAADDLVFLHSRSADI